MINDLIGLSYERRARPADGHGKSDCFMLVCEVRRRLGLHDYEKDFQWAYEQYDAGNLPMKRIMRWLLENGQKTNELVDGNVAIAKSMSGELAVGVAYDKGIVIIARGGRSFWVAEPSLSAIKLFAMLPDITQ
jgi:hypothetical protein